jgi:protein-tyrosine phosphatase
VNKTSATDPIRVDFLPVADVGLAGCIGMTFAPGKRAPGVAGNWQRDLDEDLKRLHAVYQTRTLVSLVEDDELRLLGIGDLVARAEGVGIHVVRFPFPDGGIPASRSAVAELVDRILRDAAGSANVVVHCRGGLGRTGLVAACCLIARGVEPRAAMTTVRAARRGAIETREQEKFVLEFRHRPALGDWPDVR